MKDRTMWATALALLCVVGLGVFREQFLGGARASEAFWARKILWQEKYDVVLTGDSRIVRAVSPGKMQEAWPGVRAVNFGFDGCGWTKEYFTVVEERLDLSSPQKTIVLGVTPRSLTLEATRKNTFTGALESTEELERKRRNILEMYLLLHTDHFLYFFRSFSLSEAQFRSRKAGVGYRVIRHADGWIASRRLSGNFKPTLRGYKRMFARTRGQVSPAVADVLLRQVKDWRERGIRVFGFRPPVADVLWEMEESLSGFSEPDFVEQFEAAGGVWITFPRNRYITFDSSHLTEESALALTADLTEMITQHDALN